MWFSEQEWHLGVTGVFPGRGLGKGHRQRWLRLEPRRGFREVLGEAAQSHGHKAEHVSVWAQGLDLTMDLRNQFVLILKV